MAKQETINFWEFKNGLTQKKHVENIYLNYVGKMGLSVPDVAAKIITEYLQGININVKVIDIKHR